MKRVIVNGCFDILHLGHLNLLRFAKSVPNSYVLVLIDSDLRVKELKGPERPVNSQQERLELLSALRYVDEVKIFNSDQELSSLIKEFNPDLMIKGSDYKNKKIIGAEHCKEIIFYDIIQGYSTTKKIQSITNR